MRHQVRKNKLNRDSSHRKAMLRNLAAQIIQFEHIDTTNAKARAVAPLVDKLINAGKAEDTLLARRRLNEDLYDELAVNKVLEVLKERFKDRNSGYTSIIKIKNRSGDNAQIVRVMLLEK